MNNIVEILMNRDGLSQEEAVDEYNFAMQEINAALCNGNIDDIGNILLDDLGLEEDYIFDFI